MTVTNQFVTAGDFWTGMLEPDYQEHLRNPESLRAALHAAISLFHMSDWVFHTHESQIRNAFTFLDRNSQDRAVYDAATFANALEQQHNKFGLVRGICHAAKHLKLKDSDRSQTHPAIPRTQGFKQQGMAKAVTGWDRMVAPLG
jgi:hypothetical protein